MGTEVLLIFTWWVPGRVYDDGNVNGAGSSSSRRISRKGMISDRALIFYALARNDVCYIHDGFVYS